METAVLRLGLAGFNATEEAVIRQVVAAYKGADWSCVGADGADAWLVNGARTTHAHGALVRVTCADASGHAAAIVLDTSSRPVAFSKPVAAGATAAGTHPLFALSQAASLTAALKQLERELHATKACFWTAAHLIAHHATVGKAMFELQSGTELVAVVDMKGEVAISPTATEASFDRAVWKHRARKTVAVPGWFRRMPLPELMWHYTTRTRRDMLPQRFRDGDIFFRRPPRVSPELVADIHLMISRQLAIAPAKFAQLRSAIGADDEVLARALAAMYYVGSITSNPDRAWTGSVRGALWSQPAPLEAMPSSPAHPAFRREAPPTTAPLI